MLVIGLTGGIGSGKSTVGGLFRARGVPVIDTDDLARVVVEPGRPALDQIKARFGREMIGADGRLDRHALARRVFSNPALREELEAILHPRIRAELHARLSDIASPYSIVAIPLLIEKGWQTEVDRILVVDAPEELQLRRTLGRPGMDARQVRRIMASQAGREERLAAADDIIVNDGALDKLETAVDRLHRLYSALAAGR